MTKPESKVLPVGTRVKMSALGVERSPRLVDKIGTVVRARGGRYRSLGVRFDGNKSITSLHPGYVEPLQ